MKLLRQLDIGEYDNSADPADTIHPTESLGYKVPVDPSNLPGIIGQVNGTPESQIISPQSYNNYVPQDWSPQQQAAYAAQNKPTTGKLNPEDYYPTLHHNTNVGNYSGSEIGSTTLFAPAGRIVPLGMRDARDAAVHKQVLSKLKDQDDFDKKYNSPTTKHVAVQEELSKNYQEGLHQWVDNAKKKYGQNWAQELPRDRDFNAWNKSHQDLAKYHDQISNHMAELDMAEKDPNFVLSPQLRQQHADMKSGIYSLSTGGINTRKTRDVERDYLASKGQYDLEKLANDVVPKMQKEITEEPLTNKSVSGYINGHAVTNQKTEEGISPERLDAAAHNEYMAKYQGTNISEQQVKDAFKNVAAHKTTYQSTAIAPPAEKQGKDEDYSQAVPQTTATVNQTIPNTTAKAGIVGAGTRDVAMENVYNTTAKDQQKELTFTLNKDVVDLEGKNLQNESGYVKGQVQQIGALPYYKDQKRFLTQKEYDGLKKVGGLYNNSGIEFRPGAIVNVTPKTDAKGNIKKSESVFVPLGTLKGKLGKSFDEHAIKKVEEDAASKNIKEEKPSTETTTYKIKGKDYGHSAVEKAAKASGMSVNEYLTELNKQ